MLELRLFCVIIVTFAPMKHLLTISAILLAFTCCTGRQMHEELRRVDSLNQCDVPLDSITTMQDVVAYFDRWGSDEEKMLSHYLLGRVYHDQHDIPRALRSYRNAVSYADTTDANCNYLRLSRIYGQIAELFHQQRAPRLELDAERKAVEYAWKAKDTLNAIIFYSYFDGAYHMLNEMDSALYCNQRAVQMLKDYGNYELAAGLLTMSIDIYLREKDYQHAKQAIDEMDHYAAPNGRNLLWGYKGLYYEGIGYVDSAEYYYRQLLQNCFFDSKAEIAYKGLLSISRKKGNTDSIAKYADMYCQASDSASFSHSADEIVRTQALYNYEESERIADQKSKEAEHYKRTIVLTTVVLLLIVIAAYRFVRRQERRKKEILMEANEEYISLLKQYLRTQQDLNLSKHDSDKFREAKEEEIRNLQQQLLLYQDVPRIEEHWSIEQAMLDNPLVKDLHQLASVVKKPSSVQWKEFREFIGQEMPTFYQQINRKEAKLTPQEVMTCILIRLQFSQGEIAAIYGVSKQRVNNIKASINQKMFRASGAATLNTNIMNL